MNSQEVNIMLTSIKKAVTTETVCHGNDVGLSLEGLADNLEELIEQTAEKSERMVG